LRFTLEHLPLEAPPDPPSPPQPPKDVPGFACYEWQIANWLVMATDNPIYQSAIRQPNINIRGDLVNSCLTSDLLPGPAPMTHAHLFSVLQTELMK